jgi:hypothetical protein
LNPGKIAVAPPGRNAVLESFAQLDDTSQLFAFWLALTFGFLLLFPIARGILSLICRALRLNGAWATALAVGLVAGLALAGSLYLDQTGIAVPGQVTAMEERITMGRGANWSRVLALTTRYTAAGATQPTTTVIHVDEAIFDRLRPGAAVRVRYLPEVRAIARLEEQSTLSILLSILPWDWLPVIGLAASGAALLWLLLKRRLPRLLGFPLAVIWLGWLASVLLPAAPGLEPAGPRQAAIAEVRQVDTITRSGSYRRRRYSAGDYAQPYELVELVFTPAGRDRPVVAVDAVDQGSLPGLTVGAIVAITYPPDAPRQARLTGGTRDYWWKNWLEAGLIVGGLVALLVVGRFLIRPLLKRVGARIGRQAEIARQRAANGRGPGDGPP